MSGLAVYVSLAESTEQRLAEGLRQLAQAHAAEGEIPDTAVVLARWSHDHVGALAAARTSTATTRPANPTSCTSVRCHDPQRSGGSASQQALLVAGS